MNKPYIVCHMMASVDGRIDCAMTEQLPGVLRRTGRSGGPHPCQRQGDGGTGDGPARRLSE